MKPLKEAGNDAGFDRYASVDSDIYFVLGEQA